MDILKNRYESKISVLNAHFKSLFDVRPVSKGSVNQLREFVTTISKSWKALKNLNYTHEQLLEQMVIYHLQKKLEYSMKHGFQTRIGLNTLPTFAQFYEYLNEKFPKILYLRNIHLRKISNLLYMFIQIRIIRNHHLVTNVRFAMIFHIRYNIVVRDSKTCNQLIDSNLLGRKKYALIASLLNI